MEIKKTLIYLKEYLSFRNINTSLKIFYHSILKQNTRYPKYLLDFEKKVSNYFGSKYALSFSNGTTACTALLYSLGVKKNSKVIISKLSFPSVISSILRIGATPIYLDFDEDLQIKNDIDKNKILEADYFLITHVYGIPQDFNVIKKIIAINTKLILIEDISHAQGAIVNNKIAGTLGEGSFMSMQGDKAINAGEGGMVITNSEKVYTKLIYLSHLNRKLFTKNNNLNLLSKIGFIGKGRMNPLGAITAISDINNLNSRNRILREKLKNIYEGFKNLENLHLPKIENYENTGGFHYGFPFLCESEKLLYKLKKKFKIVKYDWPILDSNESFQDPDKFLKLIYNDDVILENVFEKSNDIRDQLYFFSLKEVINLSNKEIKNRITMFSKNEN